MSFSFSKPACGAAALSALLCLPGWAAEPLTLAQAQTLALDRSQLLVANQASITASRQLALAAGRWPDPVLKLGVENLPIDGPDRLSLSRDFMTMRRIGLSQEMVRTPKLQLRAQRFEREAVRTQAESQLNRVNIRQGTALAWIDRYYAQQLRELVLRQLKETRLQAQTAQAGYGIGRNSQVDVLAARAALLLLEDRLSQIALQENNAALMLARWVGPAAQRPSAGRPPWHSSAIDEGSLAQQLPRRPDLLVLRAQIDLAQTEAGLAHANKQADWTVEAAYSQRGSAYSNMVSIGVSVPLQWDAGNRQDRELAARLALVDEARARYEEALRLEEAQLRGLLNDWNNGKERVTRYHDQLIPLASQRTEAAQTAYRTGKIDLATALLARREEVEVRMQALTAEQETARAWAQLNFLIPDSSPVAQRQERS